MAAAVAPSPLTGKRPSGGISFIPEVPARQVVTARLATPFGGLLLTAEDGLLTGLDFITDAGTEDLPEHPLLLAATARLRRYFDDPMVPLDLPLRLTGTEHARRVWNALRDIPPGATETYGALARRLGSGARAVAAACKANAFPILIPCHRVVAAQGLGGYCGMTEGPMLDLKCRLLAHEARVRV